MATEEGSSYSKGKIESWCHFPHLLRAVGRSFNLVNLADSWAAQREKIKLILCGCFIHSHEST